MRCRILVRAGADELGSVGAPSQDRCQRSADLHYRLRCLFQILQSLRLEAPNGAEVC